MSDVMTPLTVDFLAWLAAEPRDYVDVMDAWRAPPALGLRFGKDAIDGDLITRTHKPGEPLRVSLTVGGRAVLAAHGR